MNKETRPSKSTAAHDRPARREILVVEDEVLIRWSLTHYLVEHGYDVTAVESGEQALEVLKKLQFSAVVTDLGLPQIDGFAVATVVKTSSPKTPVIMLSDLGEQEINRPDEAKLIDSFVAKPFNLRGMVSLLDRLLCQMDAAPGLDQTSPGRR